MKIKYRVVNLKPSFCPCREKLGLRARCCGCIAYYCCLGLVKHHVIGSFIRQLIKKSPADPNP